jgi:hypothetical protein
MRAPGHVIGYRRDGRPIRAQAGGAYNACLPEAVDVGLAAWSLDPAGCIVSQPLATTVQYLTAIYYRPEFDLPAQPGFVYFPNGVVGTSTAFQVGLINMDPIGAVAAGTLLASSPAAGTIQVGLGKYTLTYVATAPAVLPQGRYWIAAVNTTGVTTTGLASSNPGAGNLGVNVGTDAAHSRFGIALTTGALVNIAPASIVQTVGAGLCLCAALG